MGAIDLITLSFGWKQLIMTSTDVQLGEELLYQWWLVVIDERLSLAEVGVEVWPVEKVIGDSVGEIDETVKLHVEVEPCKLTGFSRCSLERVKVTNVVIGKSNWQFLAHTSHPFL